MKKQKFFDTNFGLLELLYELEEEIYFYTNKGNIKIDESYDYKMVPCKKCSTKVPYYALGSHKNNCSIKAILSYPCNNGNYLWKIHLITKNL